DIDAAALEDDGTSVVSRNEPGQLRDPRDRLSDQVVTLPVVVLCPGVESPVGEGDVARGVVDANRSRVAQPDAIGRYEMQPHTVEQNVVCLEQTVSRL